MDLNRTWKVDAEAPRPFGVVWSMLSSNRVELRGSTIMTGLLDQTAIEVAAHLNSAYLLGLYEATGVKPEPKPVGPFLEMQRHQWKAFRERYTFDDTENAMLDFIERKLDLK